jgi:hypothetical protein
MNKNGVIAVVVVVVAVVLIGLWAMRSGPQHLSGRIDCNAAPGAPSSLVPAKTGNVVTLNWTAPPSASDTVSTYVVEAGNAPSTNNVGTFVVPGSTPTFQREAPPATYYVRVFARNACGTSAPSNEIVVTVP